MAATADYLIPTPALRRWLIDLLRAAGASDVAATRVAQRVVGAGVRGDDERGLGAVPGHVRALLSAGPSALGALDGDDVPDPAGLTAPGEDRHSAGGEAPSTPSLDDAGRRSQARRALQMPVDADTMALLDQAAASVAARSGLAPGPLSALECGC